MPMLVMGIFPAKCAAWPHKRGHGARPAAARQIILPSSAHTCAARFRSTLAVMILSGVGKSGFSGSRRWILASTSIPFVTRPKTV